MQGYRRIEITKDEIVPLARQKRSEGVFLIMIHGFLDKDGRPDISYEFANGPDVDSYHIVGETTVPSISSMPSGSFTRTKMRTGPVGARSFSARVRLTTIWVTRLLRLLPQSHSLHSGRCVLLC